MKAAVAVLLAAWAGHVAAAERPEETRSERDARDGVLGAIQAKDCARAVARLNEGLAARFPGFYLLAGTMYEEGICLKPNWERAEQLYRRGVQAGHKGGMYKLVSGLAHGPRDLGAALWWAQHADGATLPRDCLVPGWVHRDAESYAATLRSWPAGRLAACAYTAGVVATVAGDVEYPRSAIGFAMQGRVRMEFVPAHARFAWETSELQLLPLMGVVSGDALADRSSRAQKDTLRRELEEAGQRALKRYAMPPGIDPGWRVLSEYIFELR